MLRLTKVKCPIDFVFTAGSLALPGIFNAAAARVLPAILDQLKTHSPTVTLAISVATALLENNIYRH